MEILTKLFFALLVISGLTPATAMALRGSASPAVNNSILFIENAIDNEYFITPASLDPRISGANEWVRYDTGQRSLAYMGYVGWTAGTRNYVDMWIDNSPMQGTFQGIRCATGTNCPAAGHIAGEGTDENGFYHAQVQGAGITGGAYGFASFAEGAYDYFRNMAVGGRETYVLNFCSTTINYDYASGQRCKDQSSGTWRYQNFTVNKTGHLSLESTNALQEIWIASDGTPNLSKDNGYCELGTVGGTDGVICKMVAYKLNQTSVLNTSTYIRMYANTSLLGFTPAAASVRFSGDGQTWYNYSGTTTRYNNVFTNDGEYIYVYFSKVFLKNLVDRGINITQEQPFTFGFRNAVVVESGFYQFTPSLGLIFTPKEYGISIVPAGNSLSPSASGKIGDTSPIEMDYIVTVSGPRQADTITAQVIGDSTTVDGIPYCLFQSTQDGLSVAIPAYLQYNGQQGNAIQKRNSCGDPAIDMSNALWRQTPWDVNSSDDGSYFSTDLKLLFPMDDRRSMLTLSGSDWEGVVSATGEIKVTANWVGVNK